MQSGNHSLQLKKIKVATNKRKIKTKQDSPDRSKELYISLVVGQYTVIVFSHQFTKIMSTNVIPPPQENKF
jgi:hypothetical protein